MICAVFLSLWGDFQAAAGLTAPPGAVPPHFYWIEILDGFDVWVPMVTVIG